MKYKVIQNASWRLNKEIIHHHLRRLKTEQIQSTRVSEKRNLKWRFEANIETTLRDYTFIKRHERTGKLDWKGLDADISQPSPFLPLSKAPSQQKFVERFKGSKRDPILFLI